MEVLTQARERGFSLVETLLALLILALVAVSILSMFAHGVQLNASGADYTEVTNIARDKLEDLMAMGWDNPDLAATTTRSVDANNNYVYNTTLHQEAIEGGQLTVQWAVDEYSINQGALNLPEAMSGEQAWGGGNIKLITVTVVSQRAALLGQRDVTIRGVKAAV